MVSYYGFAGIEVAVHLPGADVCREERHLAPFRILQARDPHRYCFHVRQQLPPPPSQCLTVQPGFRVYPVHEGEVRYIGDVSRDWSGAHIRAEHKGKYHEIVLRASAYSGEIGEKTVLNALATEHLIAEAGGFVFHSAYIAWQGKAILFTAPSGTGKSTQAELWATLRGAEIVNGDRSCIRFEHGEAVAAGIPYAGSSQYCKNRTLPLAAVVYLRQAPHTAIRRLEGREAFCGIWEGVSVNIWNHSDMARVSHAVEQVCRSVPVFELACTPDESAVTALQQQL